VFASNCRTGGLSGRHWADGSSEGDGVSDHDDTDTLRGAGGTGWAVGDAGSTTPVGPDSGSQYGQSGLLLTRCGRDGGGRCAGGGSRARAQKAARGDFDPTLGVHGALRHGENDAGHDGQRESVVAVTHVCGGSGFDVVKLVKNDKCASVCDFKQSMLFLLELLLLPMYPRCDAV